MFGVGSELVFILEQSFFNLNVDIFNQSDVFFLLAQVVFMLLKRKILKVFRIELVQSKNRTCLEAPMSLCFATMGRCILV